MKKPYVIIAQCQKKVVYCHLGEERVWCALDYIYGENRFVNPPVRFNTKKKAEREVEKIKGSIRDKHKHIVVHQPEWCVLKLDDSSNRLFYWGMPNDFFRQEMPRITCPEVREFVTKFGQHVMVVPETAKDDAAFFMTLLAAEEYVFRTNVRATPVLWK